MIAPRCPMYSSGRGDRRPRIKQFRFRRRFLGPKRGPARGVAVFRVTGDTRSRPVGGALPEGHLREWASNHGVVLDGNPSTLAVLDQRLEEWNADASRHGRVDLPNDAGIYLGNVIVHHIDGSSWKIWPNGHPVIKIRDRKDIDVVALVHHRLTYSDMNIDAFFKGLEAPA